MPCVWKQTSLNQAIAEYTVATKKDVAYVLNRAIRNVGFRAAEFTPKTDPGKIEQELRKDKIALKFITKKLTGKKGTTYTTRAGRTRTIRRVTRKQISLRTRQFVSRRKKRTGFMRQGWVAALEASGISARKIKAGTFRGKSTLGSGRQATAQKPLAYLGNAVYGRLKGKNNTRARVQMQQALAKAMRFVADDMQTFARDRMAATAKRYSARRRG